VLALLAGGVRVREQAGKSCGREQGESAVHLTYGQKIIAKATIAQKA
jgi:hypothetical protein